MLFSILAQIHFGYRLNDTSILKFVLESERAGVGKRREVGW